MRVEKAVARMGISMEQRYFFIKSLDECSIVQCRICLICLRRVLQNRAGGLENRPVGQTAWKVINDLLSAAPRGSRLESTPCRPMPCAQRSTAKLKTTLQVEPSEF